MIKKETITREDGVTLYRTYSDTDHLIKKVKDGKVYDSAVDIADDEEYEEVNGYVYIEGPETYEEIAKAKTDAETIARKINHIGLTDKEALSVKEYYPRWESTIGKTMEQGFITYYNDSLWRARQTHTPLEVYPPSMATASLYEVIEMEHEGTKEDPIPYIPPMEIFNGKYYTEEGVLYLCNRDSGTALTHNLSALVGLYVVVA